MIVVLLARHTDELCVRVVGNLVFIVNGLDMNLRRTAVGKINALVWTTNLVI